MFKTILIMVCKYKPSCREKYMLKTILIMVCKYKPSYRKENVQDNSHHGL